MVNFIDRESMRPGRYRVTTEAGESYYVNLERADEPTVVGTPLNAEVFNKLQNDLKNDATTAVSTLQSNIKNGSVVAAKATNATNATNATKATQDGSGKNITNTYATKAELGEYAKTADLEAGSITVSEAKSVRFHPAAVEIQAGEAMAPLAEGGLYVVEFKNHFGLLIVRSGAGVNEFDLLDYRVTYHGRTNSILVRINEATALVDGTMIFYLIGMLEV